MGRKNWAAIINALSLIFLYFYLIGSILGFIERPFAFVAVIVFIVGFFAELWFVIKQFVR